jgi:hypothetical protein
MAVVVIKKIEHSISVHASRSAMSWGITAAMW